MLSLNQKQFDKASKYAKQLEATHPTDPGQIKNIGDAYYLGNDFADAKTFAQGQIDAAKKAGKLPDKNLLLVVMSADVGLKDEAGAEAVLEETVADYNDPNDWAQLIDVAVTSEGIRDVEAVWLGRLLYLTGAPASKQDMDMIGTIASHLTFFGDAVNAKAKGGTIDPDPSPRADADKKTIQDQIAAENAQPGIYSAKLAEALYSYGMYPEAEAAANVAMTKGGNSDASEAPMVLGQALTAQGKYADAKAAFAKVTGGGPATQRITRLWVDFDNAKLNPAPAAAPAAAH
jgi:tetratricopeptide (TPR) repeat protein